MERMSTSIESLTNSLQEIEAASIKLAGTAGAILNLLESAEHRDSTIASMRSLLFNHHQTCRSALEEQDPLISLVSCIVSSRLLNQTWFKMDLFSRTSFEEMKTANEIMEFCDNAMDELKAKLNEDEENMVAIFVESMDKLDSIEQRKRDMARSFIGTLKSFVDNSWAIIPTSAPSLCIEENQIYLWGKSDIVPEKFVGWRGSDGDGWPQVPIFKFKTKITVSMGPDWFEEMPKEVFRALEQVGPGFFIRQGVPPDVPWVRDSFFAEKAHGYISRMLTRIYAEHQNWEQEFTVLDERGQSIVSDSNNSFDGRLTLE